MEQIKHISNKDGCWLLPPKRFSEDLLVEVELNLFQVGDGVFEAIAKALVDDAGVAIRASGGDARAEGAGVRTVDLPRQPPQARTDWFPRNPACRSACLRPMRPFDRSSIHRSLPPAVLAAWVLPIVLTASLQSPATQLFSSAISTRIFATTSRSQP